MGSIAANDCILIIKRAKELWVHVHNILASSNEMYEFSAKILPPICERAFEATVDKSIQKLKSMITSFENPDAMLYVS